MQQELTIPNIHGIQLDKFVCIIKHVTGGNLADFSFRNGANVWKGIEMFGGNCLLGNGSGVLDVRKNRNVLELAKNW